jgi:hypothetical protein
MLFVHIHSTGIQFTNELTESIEAPNPENAYGIIYTDFVIENGKRLKTNHN